MFHFLMNHSAETGLLLFVLCFAAIALFAATRTRGQIKDWSNLPLEDSEQMLAPSPRKARTADRFAQSGKGGPQCRPYEIS